MLPRRRVRRRRSLIVPLLLVVAVLTSACSGSARISKPDAPAPTDTLDPTLPTLVAVGDIASCDRSDDEAVAALVAGQSGTLLTLGDTVYEDGTPSQFRKCYEPNWGAFRPRTRPVAGNHDYEQKGAPGYHAFFGPQAGETGRGWYSYDLAGWHLVALNSNCEAVGGCQAGSAQEQWLRADLAAHPAPCTLAYWHHPRFSSGTKHGSDPRVAGLWEALFDAGADVVLAGHEHNYERFAALDPTGTLDPDTGIREFVVGTGGRSHYGFGSPLPGSEARNSDTFGALRIALRPDGYDWRFLPVRGASFSDAGSGACH